ncbi:MAG: hypothetical protein K2K09_02280, partial [Lachnospiraceae bacterium]|nr:hypothetical protein [Lachnospiraceae bacterium]
LVGENSELKQELETIQADYEKVSQEKQQLADEKAARLDEELKLTLPKAWATTHFGDDCIVFADNEEYLQVISTEKYTLSSKGVKTIWKKTLESAATLGVMFDEINYERIGIKFPQKDGTEMLEIVLIREDGGYTLDSISGDLFNTTILLPAVKAMSQ